MQTYSYTLIIDVLDGGKGISKVRYVKCVSCRSLARSNTNLKFYSLSDIHPEIYAKCRDFFHSTI